LPNRLGAWSKGSEDTLMKRKQDFQPPSSSDLDRKENILLVEALRDFFYRGTQKELQEAYDRLTAVQGLSKKADPIDWENEEFTYNRLFVGPMAPLAPPIASYYLEPEGQLQGTVTTEIRLFYDSIGLGLASPGSEPDDSLAFELDACRHLLLLAKQLPEAEQVYRDFIVEHLTSWVPRFTALALQHSGESIAVRDVLHRLAHWVEMERQHLSQLKEMR
jgi:TorA maturation chaperone TorD